MFGIHDFPLFVVSAVLLNLTPGADSLYILSRSVSQGRSAGLWFVLGIMTGIAIHTVLASLGLSILLARSAVAFKAVKLAGAGYLIYLGVRALITRKGAITLEAAGTTTGRRIYLQVS
jgi:threonine/homoserine/homoserine lactone efflux protein